MGEIVSIHSFRGGTGKSNITANLATWAAYNGNKVAIIDTDIQSPGIHVIFGLSDQTKSATLNDYLWGKCKIEDVANDITKDLGIKKGKLYVLPAALEAGAISKILKEGYEVAQMSRGFRDIIKSKKLDYLFIDTHPGLEEETFLSIAVSDILLILMRPDEQDYLGTAVSLEIARKLEVPNMHMIINKVLKSYNPATVLREVENAFSVPVVSVIPLYDEIIHNASKEIFVLNNKKHAFTKNIDEVYRAMTTMS